MHITKDVLRFGHDEMRRRKENMASDIEKRAQALGMNVVPRDDGGYDVRWGEGESYPVSASELRGMVRDGEYNQRMAEGDTKEAYADWVADLRAEVEGPRRPWWKFW
jgi:hypothetical protein